MNAQSVSPPLPFTPYDAVAGNLGDLTFTLHLLQSTNQIPYDDENIEEIEWSGYEPQPLTITVPPVLVGTLSAAIQGEATFVCLASNMPLSTPGYYLTTDYDGDTYLVLLDFFDTPVWFTTNRNTLTITLTIQVLNRTGSLPDGF